MTEYISREEALREMCAACSASPACENEKCYSYGAVDNMPSADVPMRWIPVTERLPEDSGYYIVCAKDGTRTHVSFVKYQYRYKSWLLNGARAYWIITHWMPLPEPPKEE